LWLLLDSLEKDETFAWEALERITASSEVAQYVGVQMVQATGSEADGHGKLQCLG
jgi:hypothetical protein